MKGRKIPIPSFTGVRLGRENDRSRTGDLWPPHKPTDCEDSRKILWVRFTTPLRYLIFIQFSGP